jgi:two-component system, sensor histidine kinase and response regulator
MTTTLNPPATSRKLNILLTEDNLVNRVLAQKLLQKFGHAVTLANNGKEGATVWEANQASQFDLILMDIQMPVMDGLQATAYIRAKEKALETISPSGTTSPIHIPIVAMTAHAMKGDRERYLAGGMDGYVSKPINSAELERVIQSVVDMFSFRASLPATVIEKAAIAVNKVIFPGIEEAEILAHFDGDADLVRELAEIFIKECPKYLSDIHEAITAGDANALQRSAHTLKGSLGNFSTKDAHASVLQLETLGRAGSLDGAAEILRALREQLGSFNQILQGMVKQTVAPSL